MVEQDVPYRSGRRTAVRVLVPVGVVAVAAAGFGLAPALASDSGPSLPSLTAEQLVTKALGSDTQALSGTVKVKADLGVPAQLLGAAGGGPGGGGRSSAAPEAKLTELLGGEHTVRVAVDGPDRQRIGLIDGLSGYEVVHNGDQVWAWDSSSNEAVHLTAPHGTEKQHGKAPLTGVPTTPQEIARQFLSLSAGTTSVTVDGTAEVAGQKAYQLSVKPKQSGSTIGEVRISVDAQHGVPLAVLVKSASGGNVLDAHFSSVSFAKPDAKTFRFTAPKGAKVTERKADSKPATTEHKPSSEGLGPDGFNVVGEGWTTVLSTRLPAGELTAGTAKHGKGTPQSISSFAKALGKPVGGGSLISTKVLNVLITDDGRVFAGAVTPSVLQSAAGVK
ncbi:LolA family protein [Kitasatospora atroaurantiaca]|uniref:Outer membrane lipoprotein-sorting protein n=1 Tax=Kitasatospora atroaurantiaca TaxID=285545 RepID=A0A561EU06_9ACTN|nr:DUF2092 domain-containing protein [Kitasatospora atroaurantiaca]TWE19104.1 outer membrane lipoprotein-sorting protein [Kitasatospora atroaurantiaca]